MRSFYPLDQTAEKASPPLEDYRSARRLGGVLLGKENLYFRGFARIEYLPISRITWIYKRREDSSATVCCGRTTFATFYLVVHGENGVLRRALMEREALVDQALEALSAGNPSILVGYSRERAAAVLGKKAI